MNTSAYHQPKLLSLARLTTKGEDDGLEPGRPISPAACSESWAPQGWQGLFPAPCLTGECLLLLLQGCSWCAAQLAEAPARCGRISRHQHGKGEQLWGGCHL